MAFGPLTIELLSVEEEKHLISRVFRVRKVRLYNAMTALSSVSSLRARVAIFQSQLRRFVVDT